MPKYKRNHFNHAQMDKIGVLLTNLGTPKDPTKNALHAYLKQFLSDPRVVEVPRLIWFLVLHGIILRFRPRRSAAAYKTVWTEAGSPLAVHTEAQAEALKDRFKSKWGDNIEIDWAMRYGQPSIPSALQKLLDRGVRRLVILPLYPQYSASTSGSTFDAIAADFLRRRWLPELRFVNQYCDEPLYINALAQSIQSHWDTHGRPDKLIFSYHGIPLRYLRNGDPYHCHCHKTTRLVAEKLKLDKQAYLTSFQSRFGREAWLQPYTDKTVIRLASEGVQSIDVICPGFSADCLETIEEINEEVKGYFIEAGGKRFSYIPALNSRPEHLAMLEAIIEKNVAGWPLNQEITKPRKAEYESLRAQHSDIYTFTE